MSDDAAEARRARDHQLDKLERQIHTGIEVEQVARKVRQLREENHWAELLTKAMETRR